MRRTLLTVAGGALRFGDGPGGVDEADVAEGLGEVSEELSAAGVDLLGEQAHVVAVADGGRERAAGGADLAGQRLGLRQPEGAEEERALVALEAVVGPVAVDETS